MFKIGEFSKLTQVTVRMLRYYDEMGLLKPAEVDPWTGYRMYSAAQIPVLNQIIYLRDSGFQIAEIAAALSKKDDLSLAEQLDAKYIQIEKGIKAEKEKLRKIELARQGLLADKSDMHYQVTMKSIPSYQVFSLRRRVMDYYVEGELWKEMEKYAREKNIPVSNNTFTIYHDSDYRETDIDMELCAFVNKTGKSMDGFTYRNSEPVPIMGCTMVYGKFENIAGAYLAFADWLQEHTRYQMTGQSRQIVHRGPWNEESPDKYLTEIQIPLKQLDNYK